MWRRGPWLRRRSLCQDPPVLSAMSSLGEGIRTPPPAALSAGAVRPGFLRCEYHGLTVLFPSWQIGRLGQDKPSHCCARQRTPFVVLLTARIADRGVLLRYAVPLVLPILAWPSG